MPMYCAHLYANVGQRACRNLRTTAARWWVAFSQRAGRALAGVSPRTSSRLVSARSRFLGIGHCRKVSHGRSQKQPDGSSLGKRYGESSMKYVALVDGKAGAYGVAFPDAPGCAAMGKTMDEAIANAVR